MGEGGRLRGEGPTQGPILRLLVPSRAAAPWSRGSGRCDVDRQRLVGRRGRPVQVDLDAHRAVVDEAHDVAECRAQPAPAAQHAPLAPRTAHLTRRSGCRPRHRPRGTRRAPGTTCTACARLCWPRHGSGTNSSSRRRGRGLPGATAAAGGGRRGRRGRRTGHVRRGCRRSPDGAAPGGGELVDALDELRLAPVGAEVSWRRGAASSNRRAPTGTGHPFAVRTRRRTARSRRPRARRVVVVHVLARRVSGRAATAIDAGRARCQRPCGSPLDDGGTES